MISDLQFARSRFHAFCRQVVNPAIYGRSLSLRVVAGQFAHPGEVGRAEFRPIEVGWRWGPAWSRCRFRLAGAVPADWAGSTVALRFSSGTEAMLYRESGAPWRGFDPNRDRVVLFDPTQGNEEIDLMIEAACNLPFGLTFFGWEPPELQRRWESDKPGELQRCELVEYHETVRRLSSAFKFSIDLLAELPEDSSRAHHLRDALESAISMIDDRNVPDTAEAAYVLILKHLRCGASPTAARCIAVGHAHIDTAWLWPIRETRHKCQRTFANVLELMETYDEFRFLGSQAQQYAWIEQDSPELFERIAQRVHEGRWEPGGAMWIEPDCNVPSGESLIRQILHGTRYWESRFGERGRQRHLFLPDTFGFPATLPQIMAQAGLDTFITNKLSWNRYNEWPHMNFRWRGLDGTEVLAHLTPGHDYNSTNSPVELRRGEANAARKGRGAAPVWLQPYGYGDGGGGPTAEIIESAQFAADCEGLPQVRLGRADEFCEALHDARAELRARSDDIPVWDGELYLEYHRGTYTTQAWLKRANRRAEDALRTVEWLAAAAPDSASLTGEVIRRQFDEAWKLLLLNQFHDILPGSSIAEVYSDARRDFERIRELTDSVEATLLEHWAAALDAADLCRPLAIFNPASHERSEVIEFDGEFHHLTGIPALSGVIVDAGAESAPVSAPVEVDGSVIRNEHLEVTLDGNGRVSSLIHRATGREAAAAPLNQFVLYEDHPHAWDAWEIDEESLDKPLELNQRVEEWQLVESNPLCAILEVTSRIGDSSHIAQRFILTAGSPRLDIHTRIDWHEDHRLLRTLFPVNVRARFATYDIQFGQMVRPTHRNTTWDRAMYEVCAHRWMDLAETGFGVALLNDGKYGHSCRENVMGLSLLRSPTHPDPTADRGEHEFTYSLMPHAGDWRVAGVDRVAEALNTPLIARPAKGAGAPGGRRTRHEPFRVQSLGAAQATVSAFKLAEDDDRRILRLVETHGGRGDVEIEWSLPVSQVAPVDLLERPAISGEVTHDEPTRRTRIHLRPYEIVTLAVALHDEP